MKQYIKAQIEVIFMEADVITSSGETGDTGSEISLAKDAGFFGPSI